MSGIIQVVLLYLKVIIIKIVEEFNFTQIPSVISNQIIGSIDQKLGFIEIPVELDELLMLRDELLANEEFEEACIIRDLINEK